MGIDKVFRLDVAQPRRLKLMAADYDTTHVQVRPLEHFPDINVGVEVRTVGDGAWRWLQGGRWRWKKSANPWPLLHTIKSRRVLCIAFFNIMYWYSWYAIYQCGEIIISVEARPLFHFCFPRSQSKVSNFQLHYSINQISIWLTPASYWKLRFSVFVRSSACFLKLREGVKKGPF